MSTRPSLAAEPRTVTGKKVNSLRRDGILPAVIFGVGQESQAIQIQALDWEILRRKHVTKNTLLDITVAGGKATPVLVQSFSEDPRSRKPTHIDFHVVKMGEELTVDVPVEFVGTSSAVEKDGGTLLHLKETLHIKAKPGDLPTSIVIDVSSLADFDATLHVSDISAPKGVTILTDAAEPIARVMAPRTEAAEEAVDLAAGAPAEESAADEA